MNLPVLVLVLVVSAWATCLTAAEPTPPREMVLGALANSHAQVAVSVSGTAGPTGGTPDKPVGTVCFAWGVKNGEPKSALKRFNGDREAVRRQAVRFALEGVLALLPATPESKAK